MLTMLKLVVLILFVGWSAWRSVRVTMDAKGNIAAIEPNVRWMAGGLVGFVALLILLNCVGYVSTGYRGVVLRWSAVTGRVLDEGLYMVQPLRESVEEMSVQIEADEMEAPASSKDLQNVTTKVTLNYFLMPDRVTTVYQTLRHDYDSKIIDPSIQEAVKATTAKYDAEELITRRQEVRDGIQQNLTARLSAHGIQIDAISITNFKFSDDFEKAIEAKVTAGQNALKAENDLKRIKLEADQAIAHARGQAEAIRVQAEAVRQQGGEAYVALEWIKRWNGNPPQMIMGQGQNTSLLFQVPKVGN